MSQLIVEVCKIDKVEKHPDADRLDICTVKGWQCVTGKDQFKEGDICAYFPIDAILPDSLVQQIFGADSKIVPTKGRIKTIRIRKAISQGLCARLDQCGLDPKLKVGTDIMEKLGVTKYDPDAHTTNPFTPNKNKIKRKNNPLFSRYTDIQNIKNFIHLFGEDEIVSGTEKIHGTNFRCGWLPFFADTIWKKIKQFFGFAPAYEFVFGSHNVQLQSKLFYTGYYDSNVYAEAIIKNELQKKLKEGEVVYGEVYGDGVQKGYTYGCAPGVRLFAAFDVQIPGELKGTRKWLNPDEFRAFCHERSIPTVKEIYRGKYDLAAMQLLINGPKGKGVNSFMHPEQKVMEGMIVKPLLEETTYMGRKALKMISDEYYLGKQTEFH